MIKMKPGEIFLHICTLCTFMVIVRAAKAPIHGVFQKAPSMELFNKALQDSRVEGASTYLEESASLNDVISTLKGLKREINKSPAEQTVFVDFAGTVSSIVKEVVNADTPDAIGGKEHGIVHVNSLLNGTSKLLQHELVLDELIPFMDDLSEPKGLSVIVDDSKYSETTLSKVLQKGKRNRKVNFLQIISTKNIDKVLSTLSNKDNTFSIVDTDGNTAADFLVAARKLGLAGFSGMFTWAFSQRAKDSLASICSRAEGHYMLFEYVDQPVTANNILSAALGMEDSCAKGQRLNCSNNASSSSKVQRYRLWTGDRTSTWVSMQKSETSLTLQFNIVEGRNPLWPRRRVAIANTWKPWITVIDYHKTKTDSLCGLGGRFGYRYASPTSNITVPICAYGVSIDILKLLEEKLEFVGEILMARDGLYGSYNATTGESNGIIREIAHDKADLSMDLMEDTTRSKVVQFTTPLTIVGNAIAYIQENQYKSSVFGPFHEHLWLTIFFSVVFLMIFVWFSEKVNPQHYRAKDTDDADGSATEETFGAPESMNYSWGIFFSGEIIDKKPRSFGSRITLITFSFFSILIIAAYSANLIAFFVVLDEKPLTSGLYDEKLIGKDSKLKVGIVKATSIANFLQFNPDSRLANLYRRSTHFSSFGETYSALKNRKIDLAIADSYSLKHEAGNDKDCAVKVVPIVGSERGIAIVFAKGSTWKNRFNHAVMDMTGSGKADKLFATWFSWQKCTRSVPFIELTIKQMDTLFIYLCYGVAGCLVIALILACWTLLTRCFHKRKGSLTLEQPS